MTQQRGFSHIRFLALLTVVLGIASIYLVFTSLGPSVRKEKDKPVAGVTPSPAVLAIPSVAGIVSHLEGDTLNVTVQTDKGAEDRPVTLSEQTKITRKPLIIPYQFNKKPELPLPPIDRAQIREGERVEVMLAQDNHSADEVLLPRIPYVLHGKIVSKNGDSLTVNAAPVLEVIPIVNGSPLLPSLERYIVKMTTETEISHESKRYAMNDLTDGQEVTIYAKSDVTQTQNVTAAMVEPIL